MGIILNGCAGVGVSSGVGVEGGLLTGLQLDKAFYPCSR